MSKRKTSTTVIPRSMLPNGAQRVTNKQGERVWMFKGMEFASKRDLLAKAFKAIEGPKAVEGTIEGITPEAEFEVIMNEEKPDGIL